MKNISERMKRSGIASISEVGYCVIEGWLEKEKVEQALTIINGKATPSPHLSSGVSENQSRDKYVYHLQFLDSFFLDILTESNILEIIHEFLNDEWYHQLPEGDPNFLLAYYNARSSVAALPLHQDNYIPYRDSVPISMQLIVSLSGQNEENGATVVVPGSHLSGELADRDCKKIETLRLDPGDAVIWDSRLWHGAMANLSLRDRWSLVATFRQWWAKQNYDPVRGFNEKQYQKMSHTQKALTGFLSLPAVDDQEKVSLKEGYPNLLGSIFDYRSRRCNED